MYADGESEQSSASEAKQGSPAVEGNGELDARDSSESKHCSNGSKYSFYDRLRVREAYRIWFTRDEVALYDATIFVFNKDMDRLEYVTGLQPSTWCRLPRELVISIAEALRDLLLEHMSQSEPRELAMTCRTWRTLFSPLWWRYWCTAATSVSQLHDLEVIISSPLSGTAKDHIGYLRLNPGWDNGDKESYRFVSAWRSLSRCLPQVAHLKIGAFGPGARPQFKSPSISLRPCPRPLLHLRNLELVHVTFPSFSALFRDIGALPSLEWLSLYGIRWNRAYDSESPPSSTATFGSTKRVYASGCTARWLFIWIFTSSSLGYRHPWRVPDDEETCTRSVRADVRAIGQAFRWALRSARGVKHASAVQLEYVGCVPKGLNRFTASPGTWLDGVGFGITVTAPTSSGLMHTKNAYGSLLQLVILCQRGSKLEEYDWEELRITLSGVMHPFAVDIISTRDFDENAEAIFQASIQTGAQASIQASIPNATIRLHTIYNRDGLWEAAKVVEKFWEQMDGAGANAAPAGL